MDQNFQIYFHLGLPKVASSYLQKEIFPYISDIKFHKKHRFKEFKNLKETPLSANHLFSSEKDKRLTEMVDEIISLFPDARIILIVRRQDQWIYSRYKYYIRKHGWKSFEEFFDMDFNKGLWKKEDLLFQRIIEYIDSKCKVKPLVLTHDLLRAHPEQFLQQITAYMNSYLDPKVRSHAIVNSSFSDKQLIILRRFNGIVRYKRLRTKYPLLNIVHYKYWQFLLHMLAFISQLVPGFFIRERKLLSDPNVLERIKNYYDDDWKFCTDYSKSSMVDIPHDVKAENT
ncbi:MAG: hypothetical protein PF450_00730 [Bacteroidales bacterium]|jgi:hypothetical protein|nr:hypothetical protein [Bacteroidales bacterium]